MKSPDLQRGEVFEHETAAKLKLLGWAVAQYGVGRFDADERIAAGLHAVESPLMCSPDLLIVRGTDVRFVECKSPTHSVHVFAAIEAADLRASYRWRNLHPLYIVWRGLGVIDSVDAVAHARPGPQAKGGTDRWSGLPYVVLEQRWLRDFEDVFG